LPSVAEDWPGLADHIDQSHTLLGNSMLDFYEHRLRLVAGRRGGADFHQPFSSDVPMLILSGELRSGHTTGIR
jgi:hypothetical protein